MAGTQVEISQEPGWRGITIADHGKDIRLVAECKTLLINFLYPWADTGRNDREALPGIWGEGGGRGGDRMGR